MKTPQIMVDRLKAITDTEEKAQHIANIIELASNDKIKDDFDVRKHIASILTHDTEIDIANFDYKAIQKPVTRTYSQEVLDKRYQHQLEKLNKKYGKGGN